MANATATKPVLKVGWLFEGTMPVEFVVTLIWTQILFWYTPLLFTMKSVIHGNVQDGLLGAGGVWWYEERGNKGKITLKI